MELASIIYVGKARWLESYNGRRAVNRAIPWATAAALLWSSAGMRQW